MKMIFFGLAMCLATLLNAQNTYYNKSAGVNAPMQVVTDELGKPIKTESGEILYKPVTADNFGNPKGNSYDLAVDGAFKGQTIAVLHLYTGENFDFELPKQALAEKGFSVYRWLNQPPSPDELKKALDKSCQLWIISSHERKLSEAHINIIKAYFDQGHGVYIWGDNDPFYSDANAVANALFGGSMQGNTMGNTVVSLQENQGKQGIVPGHLITTGLQFLYEGVTIATIEPSPNLQPILYGSAGNLVTAVYEQDGKRAILDGGFTRLYIMWDTAGTGRYVKNAAAWLANVERFGEVSVKDRKK